MLTKKVKITRMRSDDSQALSLSKISNREGKFSLRKIVERIKDKDPFRQFKYSIHLFGSMALYDHAQLTEEYRVAS